MIKITKYIYIHILTVVLLIVSILVKKSFEFISVYSVMLVHEMAHLVAAKAIGLGISHVSFYPFGCNLRLKNKMICALSDEIILYASGPLCNAVLALVMLVMYKHMQIYELRYLYISNIVLFVINLLPVFPLDGGVIIKKILSFKWGIKKSQQIVKLLSVIISFVMILSGLYVVYLTKYNFSVLLLAVLTVGNIFTQQEKYNVDFVKELMFYRSKKTNKASIKVANEKMSLLEISKILDFGKYSIVFRIDSNGKIKKVMTETEIIDKILN